MKNKYLKLFIIALASILGAHFTFLVPTFADCSNICDSSCNVPDDVKKANGCNGNGDALPSIITGILNAIIAVCGLVAVIYVIIGGVQYMTASGDTSKLEKAKKTILYALIGLIICALAFAIVNWTIGVLNSNNNP